MPLLLIPVNLVFLAVFIDAEHHCMSTRGVLKNDVTMTTNLFSGCFLEDTNLQDRFLKMAT